ncbi:GntR family transcriptional regulator [Streptomyces showdoensis]|uniref:GntR family transcriptional regulator n=1 Tax=Streptomyces showdoensis TaxID=68268 RepID=A0A2P2GF46_STREW|nr:GntR family transcriptional regulator [Streptomyces showdoensis]
MASRRHAIADDLRTQISTGHIKPGERLPSEAQLAAHYTVSTPTLRNALALLQAEGLVEKVHGKGNFIRHPLPRITYVGGGHTVSNTTLDVSVRTTKVRARGHLTNLLQVAAGTPLTEFLYLSQAGKSPHSLVRIYIPRDLAPAATPGESPGPKGAAAALLAEPRLPLFKVQESICARLPTPTEAATLRISSTLAVLAITRVTADTTGHIVEVALLTLPGDRAEAVFTTHLSAKDRRAEG